MVLVAWLKVFFGSFGARRRMSVPRWDCSCFDSNWLLVWLFLSKITSKVTPPLFCYSLRLKQHKLKVPVFHPTSVSDIEQGKIYITVSSLKLMQDAFESYFKEAFLLISSKTKDLFVYKTLLFHSKNKYAKWEREKVTNWKPLQFKIFRVQQCVIRRFKWREPILWINTVNERVNRLVTLTTVFKFLLIQCCFILIKTTNCLKQLRKATKKTKLRSVIQVGDHILTSG